MQASAQIVGILNLTPDSFSSDGVLNSELVFARTQEIIESGAHIIDIGAESTRPSATPLTAEQEWQRLEPLLPTLIEMARDANILVSIDTRHPTTATQALAAGADWINDVSGLQSDAMLAALANHPCPIVFMHSLSIPANPEITVPEAQDIINTLCEFAIAAVKKCKAHGIRKERLIFDAGLGFGKTAEQSLEILQRIDELKTLELPLFIGHSRKSFLAKFSKQPASERDSLTLAVSEYLLTKNVQFLRVHNVARHAELLKLHAALHAPKP